MQLWKLFTLRRTPLSLFLLCLATAVTFNSCGGSSNDGSSAATAPPVAVNDVYSVGQNAVLNVASKGVLTNDTDADGDSLTAHVVTGPVHGTLSMNANGSFTYVPTTNFNGSDSFTYQAFDGSASSNVATVGITVNAIPAFTITSTAGEHGTISPSGAVSVNQGANQTFTITPDPGYNILDVLVDGSSAGPVANHTFTNVQATHTIAASFLPIAAGSGTLTAPLDSSGMNGKPAVIVGGRQYVVQNNVWSSGVSQTVTYNGTSFQITQQTGDNSGSKTPVSYPSVFIGNNNNRATTDSNLPKQISAITSVDTTWTWASGGAIGIYNAAYNVWFTSNASGNISAPDKFLMVCFDHASGKQPRGSVIATGSLTEVPGTWTVWSDGICISYVATSTIHSMSFDLKAFIRDAVERGVLTNSMYLHDVFAGFEIWSGGVGLTSSGFSAVVR